MQIWRKVVEKVPLKRHDSSFSKCMPKGQLAYPEFCKTSCSMTAALYNLVKQLYWRDVTLFCRNVNGVYRIALFAKHDIDPNTEITYDYNFHSYNMNSQVGCYVTSTIVSGYSILILVIQQLCLYIFVYVYMYLICMFICIFYCIYVAPVNWRCHSNHLLLLAVYLNVIG